VDLKEKAKNIKLLVVDVDGTLTNGDYQVNEDGKVSKSFYTRDFHYIEKILKMGDYPMCVLLLTSSWDNCIVSKYTKLSYCDRWNFLLKVNSIDKRKYIEEEIIDVKNERKKTPLFKCFF